MPNITVSESNYVKLFAFCEDCRIVATEVKEKRPVMLEILKKHGVAAFPIHPRHKGHRMNWAAKFLNGDWEI